MARPPAAHPTAAVWPLLGLAIVAATLAQAAGTTPIGPLAVGAVALATFLFALPFLLGAQLHG